MKTGPNNTSGVVWAHGVLYSSVFITNKCFTVFYSYLTTVATTPPLWSTRFQNEGNEGGDMKDETRENGGLKVWYVLSPRYVLFCY